VTAVTNEAISEAKAYIERSLEQQEKLGYKKPPARVIQAAVKDAAKAVDALLGLRARTTQT
jgi:hypothetical protein